MTTDTIQGVKTQAEQRLANLTGGAIDHVQVLNVQQRSLRDNGFLVDVDVTGISQFYASVDWHDDLGIPANDERRTSGRLTPGRKCLVRDVGIFRSLETRARRNLERYSFEIGVFGGYRYIPDTAFAAWWAKHQEIIAEFESAKAKVIDEYDRLLSELEEDFTRMARETWMTLLGRSDSETRAWLQSHDIDQFTAEVVGRARGQMPRVKDIETKTAIILRPMATFLLSDEQAEIELRRQQTLAEAQKLQEERDHWARQERAYTERQESMARAARAEEYERTRQAQAQTREVERIARAEAEAQIKRVEAETAAIKSAQLEIARKAVKALRNPFEEIINGLRGQVLETTREVLNNIAQHGRVLGKTQEKISNMIEMFRLLNVVSDPQLEEAINNLAGAMNIAGTETRRDTAAIRAALKDVARIAQAQMGETVEDVKATADWTQLEL